MVSIYHLAMMFPAGDLVGEVRGDQAKSRQCYAMSTRVAEKQKRVAEKQKMVNTVFHLKDVEAPPAPDNISHTLEELDQWEREKEKRSRPIEELESIKLDD